ncbi:MAG: polyisoprenoid-binding protein YceI [Bacteroidia bacterium]|jgi:polyisoprenoid-binding protein YceI
MIKKIKTTTFLSFIALSLFSFTTAITSADFTVLAEKSSIKWTGYKPGGEHKGTVNIKSGSLDIENDIIQSGTVIIDMPTIKVTDSESAKLLNHLRGEDFFNVKNFPTSTLVITSSKSVSVDTSGKHTLEVTGNMTILGKTESITFQAINTAKTDNYMFYNSNITIDRTMFGITYKSSMFGDAMIKDNFELAVKLRAKKN